VIHQLATSADIFDDVRKTVMNRSADPAKIQAALDDFNKFKPPLDDDGVRERKANYLYYSLKALPDVDSDRYFRDRNLITSLNYYLYAREWSSKLFVISVLVAATLGIAIWARRSETHLQVYEARYYLWRFEKSNSTAVDRFRAIQHLELGLRSGNVEFVDTVRRELTRQLRFDMLPTDTADRILELLLDKSLTGDPKDLLEGLADALRTANPDVRSRTQKELLYIADLHHLPIPAELRIWKPGKEDAPTCVDAVVRVWAGIAETKAAPEAGALTCLAVAPQAPQQPAERHK
jgi:hypothetical protein